MFTVLFIRGVILLTHGKQLLGASFHEGRFVPIERQENEQSTILIFDFVIVPICVLFSVFDFIRSMIHFPELRLILIYSYTECKGRDLQRWIRPLYKVITLEN
jgi:aromatic ring hydroxylase